MLCRNCNYILSGEEAFCPHCGQSVKTQEEENSQNDKKDIPLSGSELPSSKAKNSIFETESIDFPAEAEKKAKNKRSKGAATVISLLVVILIIIAAFTTAEYFDLAPAIASFISGQTSSDDNPALITTTNAELSGKEGMIAPEINYKPTVCTVTSTKPLPLRKGPHDTYAPVGTVPYGTRLQITGGCVSSDNWVYVYIPSEDCYGWLSASYLLQDSVLESTTLPTQQEETESTSADSTEKETEDEKTPSPQKRTAKITAEKGLYLRVGPGVDFEAVTVIGKDEKVTVIEVCQSDPSWIYVEFENRKGYVNSNYISEM